MAVINILSSNTSYALSFKKTHALYLLILLMIIGTIASLPFIRTTISTKATGVTRPITERTELKPVMTGFLEKLYYKEGDTVAQGAVVARLRDDNTGAQTVLSNYELNQRQQYIRDLEILTSSILTSALTASLYTPTYQQQLNRYLYQRADQEASLKKVRQELEMNQKLFNDKVIARKEMFDKEVENEKLQAAYQASARDQISTWQQELARYKLEQSQLQADSSKLTTGKKNFEIKAPVSGIIQGINNRYEGGILQAGETLCSISPESDLVAECYVNTRDVGLLKPGQEARFQVDAFDYNCFGILTGKIVSIDNDFTLVENQPVFKVRCSFDSKQLHLKNGFSGQLKKGLSLQARFVVAERTLWQLLFDKIDDWLNPAAPKRLTAEGK